MSYQTPLFALYPVSVWLRLTSTDYEVLIIRQGFGESLFKFRSLHTAIAAAEGHARRLPTTEANRASVCAGLLATKGFILDAIAKGIITAPVIGGNVKDYDTRMAAVAADRAARNQAITKQLKGDRHDGKPTVPLASPSPGTQTAKVIPFPQRGTKANRDQPGVGPNTTWTPVCVPTPAPEATDQQQAGNTGSGADGSGTGAGGDMAKPDPLQGITE